MGNADGEGAIKYPWVGLDPEADTSGLTKAEAHARELFMSGQHDMFSIGGGWVQIQRFGRGYIYTKTRYLRLWNIFVVILEPGAEFTWILRWRMESRKNVLLSTMSLCAREETFK